MSGNQTSLVIGRCQGTIAPCRPPKGFRSGRFLGKIGTLGHEIGQMAWALAGSIPQCKPTPLAWGRGYVDSFCAAGSMGQRQRIAKMRPR